jgi:hypothetical protein
MIVIMLDRPRMIKVPVEFNTLKNSEACFPDDNFNESL